jgi:prevent-host-death family protein
MHDAKTHFSRLVQRVSVGETIIIARSGEPVAKLAPLDAPSGSKQERFGFLKGRIATPADFDRMFDNEIADEFGVE